MTSYLSALLTNTTSKYTSIRRILLSDESDGDTEDDSHISRVLRAYYVEKARPFPPWLPPDPKSAAPIPSYAQQPGASQRYGGNPQAGGRRGGGLSDLWDSPAERAPPAPQSLRNRGAGSPGPTGGPVVGGRPLVGGARPLPSQREGSMQGMRAQQLVQEEGGRGGGGLRPSPSTASSATQNRLKARLYGSQRSVSPGAGGDARNPYDGRGA